MRKRFPAWTVTRANASGYEPSVIVADVAEGLGGCPVIIPF